jgi:hypothetical protein
MVVLNTKPIREYSDNFATYSAQDWTPSLSANATFATYSGTVRITQTLVPSGLDASSVISANSINDARYVSFFVHAIAEIHNSVSSNGGQECKLMLSDGTNEWDIIYVIGADGTNGASRLSAGTVSGWITLKFVGKTVTLIHNLHSGSIANFTSPTITVTGSGSILDFSAWSSMKLKMKVSTNATSLGCFGNCLVNVGPIFKSNKLLGGKGVTVIPS